MRKKKEILKYLDEAFDKVWYMRNQTCYDNEMEDKRRISVKRIIEKYPEVLDGFDSWDCGFLERRTRNTSLGTRRRRKRYVRYLKSRHKSLTFFLFYDILLLKIEGGRNGE